MIEQTQIYVAIGKIISLLRPEIVFGNIHVPPFWENDASAYFSTIELMFQEARMTLERSRYLALVTTLSRDASVFKSAGTSTKNN